MKTFIGGSVNIGGDYIEGDKVVNGQGRGRGERVVGGGEDRVMGKTVTTTSVNFAENADTFGIPPEVWERMPERAKDVIRRANGQ